ncbi:hypothetical protein C8J57DRAFT_1473470 [Mycena rebaudengoi]|nr:hypothetical protein C8J57DRAFT_1473470 [Mycena rebaudengoi]
MRFGGRRRRQRKGVSAQTGRHPTRNATDRSAQRGGREGHLYLVNDESRRRRAVLLPDACAEGRTPSAARAERVPHDGLATPTPCSRLRATDDRRSKARIRCKSRLPRIGVSHHERAHRGERASAPPRRRVPGPASVRAARLSTRTNGTPPTAYSPRNRQRSRATRGTAGDADGGTTRRYGDTATRCERIHGGGVRRRGHEGGCACRKKTRTVPGYLRREERQLIAQGAVGARDIRQRCGICVEREVTWRLWSASLTVVREILGRSGRRDPGVDGDEERSSATLAIVRLEFDAAEASSVNRKADFSASGGAKELRLVWSAWATRIGGRQRRWGYGREVLCLFAQHSRRAPPLRGDLFNGQQYVLGYFRLPRIGIR